MSPGFPAAGSAWPGQAFGSEWELSLSLCQVFLNTGGPKCRLAGLYTYTYVEYLLIKQWSIWSCHNMYFTNTFNGSTCKYSKATSIPQSHILHMQLGHDSSLVLWESNYWERKLYSKRILKFKKKKKTGAVFLKLCKQSDKSVNTGKAALKQLPVLMYHLYSFSVIIPFYMTAHFSYFID